MKRRHRGDRLADAAGLEQGLGRDRADPELCDAKSLRPFDGAMMDDGDADAWHTVSGHAVLEPLTNVRIVLLDHLRCEARADIIDSTLDFGREHTLSSNLFWSPQQSGETQQGGQQAKSCHLHRLFPMTSRRLSVARSQTREKGPHD
jgi:hypothetical protein